VSDKKTDTYMTEPIPDSEAQEEGQTETQISPTSTKGGRPTRQSPEPAKWTVRGIEPETRRVIEKAAERTGKTLGQFFNDELREAATNVIKKGNQPPAKAEDLVTDLVEKLKVELKDSQATELQSIREAIERRPASFREWLFGKK
jgi:uncharacterized protein (DUF1778 family)